MRARLFRLNIVGIVTAEKEKRGNLLRVYADIRMVKIVFLGFISGFPWLLIASMLTLWLKDEGLSRSGITLFGAVFAVYAFNALWAPLVDGVKIPFLTARFGRRRSWILLMQAVIAVAMAGMFALPSAEGYLWWVALLTLIIAIASATQDVAIDAMRIELIGEDEPEKIGAGSAMAVSGWWLGFGGGKALAFPFVQWLQETGVANAWQAGYLSLIVVVALCACGVVFFLRVPAAAAANAPNPPPASLREAGGGVMVRALKLYVSPIASFIRRYTLGLALALLGFIFFFKIGEAFLGKTSLIFYKEIGFSTSEIGLLSGGLGTVTICVFAIFGSFFNARYGLFKGIVLGGIAMASTNLLFAVLAHYPEKWLFVTAVVADQFTTAVSTVAFVAFLSQLCDRRYTATQYAALASVGNGSRTLLAAGSGALVDALGGNWALFFVITVMMVLPSLLVLFIVRKQLAPIMTGKKTNIL